MSIHYSTSPRLGGGAGGFVATVLYYTITVYNHTILALLCLCVEWRYGVAFLGNWLGCLVLGGWVVGWLSVLVFWCFGVLVFVFRYLIFATSIGIKE